MAPSTPEAGWVDHGVVPPQRLPASPDQAAHYLAEALGHPVYERWTWRRLVTVYGALPDARRAKPAVCRLLIEAPEAVEVWQRGRLRTLTADAAPEVSTVVLALLKSHAKRFRAAGAGPVTMVLASGDAGASTSLSLEGTLSPPAIRWLQGRGRLANPHSDTNTLGATNDLAALAAFLRERASRSRHTWRAYVAELQQLAHWCLSHDCGPLSDLTRQELLAYRTFVEKRQQIAGAATSTDSENSSMPRVHRTLSKRSQARAMAVVASLFKFWHDTGYILGNPAAGVGGGARSRSSFDPSRFVSQPLLEACDACVERSNHGAPAAAAEDPRTFRRAAVWFLYRCSGVRLAELAWNASSGLPRAVVDERGDWTLFVRGKGDKERAIPLPRRCVDVLRAYRVARGLPAEPGAFERVALIHGEKGSALGSRGLYEEVKWVLDEVARSIETKDLAGATLLRAASPHWLRHAYARSLIVDHRVPLPAAQTLLGHASVQTTAEYAKTDLSKLREFVEQTFTGAPSRQSQG